MNAMIKKMDLQVFHLNSLKFQHLLNLKTNSQMENIIYLRKIKNRKAIPLKEMKFLSVM